MATREGQAPFLQICKLPIQSITGLTHLFFPPGHQLSSCLIKKKIKSSPNCQLMHLYALVFSPQKMELGPQQAHIGSICCFHRSANLLAASYTAKAAMQAKETFPGKEI